ncbi:MAG: threonine synthase [Myxococcales bacterium]|nr:threonine synthase [Myxococcales bacterium]
MDLGILGRPAERASFFEAVRRGAPPGGGLYLPSRWPTLPVGELMPLAFPERSLRILEALCGPEVAPALRQIIVEAFDFPLPLVSAAPQRELLELFWGPTAAFKDFGARFLGRLLSWMAERTPGDATTVLTATSGDTGAAAAAALWKLPGVRCAVLYPARRISLVQERMLGSFGDNVRAFRVEGSFDDCQRLVKAAFADPTLSTRLGLTSANSINVARLYAQVCYYFEAAARTAFERPWYVVPSGNFGNLTAGLLAWRMGLPARGFVAATNRNATVPEYLATGRYHPRPAVATPSSAMDVGDPNNWPRIKALFANDLEALRRTVSAASIGDAETLDTIRRWHREHDRLIDPHTAVGLAAADAILGAEPAVVLATAHPAKFPDIVQGATGVTPPRPAAIEAALARPFVVEDLPLDAAALAQTLLAWK